jgi:hypothetical protein
VLRVREHRLQLHRAGGGVDLVVQQHQLAGAQRLVAVARIGLPPPAARGLRALRAVDVLEGVVGQREHDRDRIDLVDHHQPVASAAWTMLPRSTSRAPTRPLIGAVMVVKLSCTWA